MDDKLLNNELMRLCGKRFGSHKVLRSKYVPKIPASADREYIRLINAYMNILKETLEEELPKLKLSYKPERDLAVKEMRADGETDLMMRLTDIFNGMMNKVLAKTEGFGLRRKLESIANINRRLTVKEWKKAVRATLGIDIREDYYLGEFFDEMLEKWVDENVNLIKTIPQNTLDRMKDVVYEGYAKGKRTTDMAKEIQRAYSINKRHARFIARDQTAKLNGKIQQAQQQDAGIEEYIWTTSKDERVRRSHRELDGKKFRWDKPPINSDGRSCHPGEDYNCRCIALPVFDMETITLPADISVKAKIKKEDRFYE